MKVAISSVEYAVNTVEHASPMAQEAAQSFQAVKPFMAQGLDPLQGMHALNEEV